MQEIKTIKRACGGLADKYMGHIADGPKTSRSKYRFKFQEVNRRTSLEKLPFSKWVQNVSPRLTEDRHLLKEHQAQKNKHRYFETSPVSSLARYKSQNDLRPYNDSSRRKTSGINLNQSTVRNLLEKYKMPIKSPLKRPSPTIYGSDTKQPIIPSLKDTASTLSLEYFPRPTCSLKTTRAMERQHRLSDFKMLWQIGRGRFSVVKAAKHKYTNFLVAIKIILKIDIRRQRLQQTVQRQIAVHSSLRHPYIIQYYTNFEDQEAIYIVLELAQAELYKKLNSLGSFNEKTTSIVCRSILEAIAHMHHRGILHRDIKPQNIVLTSGVAKLCDMGWSVKTGHILRTTRCGTPIYASPELLTGSAYNQKNDLWAIGVLTYEMFFGKPPFNINGKQELNRIITDSVTFPSNKPSSKSFRQFISITLNKNPDHRMDCDEMLRHPFITKYKDSDIPQQLL